MDPDLAQNIEIALPLVFYSTFSLCIGAKFAFLSVYRGTGLLEESILYVKDDCE